MCSSNEKQLDDDAIVNDAPPQNETDEDGWSDSGDFFSNDHFEYNNVGEANVGVDDSTQSKCADDEPQQDLADMMLRLKQRQGDDFLKDYRERIRIVQAQMGNMTLCRGERGQVLFEAGAITALLPTLAEIFDALPPPSQEIAIDDDEGTEAVLFATCCWGAIRDLSCHNANVRAAVRTFTSDNNTHDSGLKLMTRYLAFYDSTSWQDIASRQHLSLLTSVIGAIRNITHSTGENCVELHEYGVTFLLTWRLLHSGPELPDVNQPWREAAFRSGASLINMSEKCPECATECARNVTLLHILIECWGGKATKTMKAPMLHLGLAAILKAAKDELPPEVYVQSWNDILVSEEKRKQRARRCEQARIEQLLREQTS